MSNLPNLKSCQNWLQSEPPADEIAKKLDLVRHKLSHMDEAHDKFEDFLATEQELMAAIDKVGVGVDSVHKDKQATKPTSASDYSLDEGVVDAVVFESQEQKLSAFELLKKQHGMSVSS